VIKLTTVVEYPFFGGRKAFIVCMSTVLRGGLAIFGGGDVMNVRF